MMSNHLTELARALSLGIWLALATTRAGAAADGDEFFEKRIRPTLAERCYKCHSSKSEKLKGGLRLDSREAMLKGGDTAPAVVPGQPEKSLLVEAVRYGNVDLQMPPKGMLSKEQIADFEQWVRMGAPWPGGGAAATPVAKAAFNLDERKRFWCWQRLRLAPPPKVTRADWPANDVDRFLLAALEEHHLSPAPAADRRTLIRRLYFDLTGLPPAPAEVEQFATDTDPGAWERLVDRLLASPRYGERWARHWLDLVRYSETFGHEFDFAIPNTWQYRDYVIRAFNEDLPYHRFVLEQVAGDLLPPRLDPEGKLNESMVATAFLTMAQQTHSPVDARQHQADLVDNEIDVLTKTFLGLTVACARCHDHKFDAITTRDYYSLYGILESSRFALRAVNHGTAGEWLSGNIPAVKAGLRSWEARGWLGRLDEVETNLTVLQSFLVSAGEGRRLQPPEAAVARTKAAALGADWPQVQRWLAACGEGKTASPAHPFHGSSEGSGRGGDVVYADGAGGGFAKWRLDGVAMADNPVRTGDFMPGNPTNAIAALPEAGTLHSGLRSARYEGSARSPTFFVSKNYIHVLASGRGSRLNIVVDNFVLIRDPIYGGLKHGISSEQPKWITADVARWKGQRAYLEFEDIWQPDAADPSVGSEGYPKDAYFAVQQVVFSDDAKAPAVSAGRGESISWSDLAKPGAPHEIRRRLEMVIKAWGMGEAAALEADPAAWRLARWMARERLLDPPAAAKPSQGEERSIAELWAQLHAAEQEIQPPVYLAATAEGNGLDETVFIRGIPRNPGPVVARRFLEAISGTNQPPCSEGSGRMELAHSLIDPANPLTARVMVNRIWSHLFGQGLVPSTDNFGALGQAPSHPELLDWLAFWYQRHGWSNKQLIRMLVTSRAYQMSSHSAGDEVESADPGDRLLHRMRVRRLEGEAIRDAILSVAGDIKTNLYGPSVPVHLTPFMDGRGRPGKSGPLDGDGRRSVYLEVRRNFLNPFMLAFDAPAPFTTVGRRTDSNLPAQALILLNDPFVTGQAAVWARRVLAGPSTEPRERIRGMYLTAFSRPPDTMEEKAALDFLETQGVERGVAPEFRSRDEQLWADLAHVLLNVNEFIYLE